MDGIEFGRCVENMTGVTTQVDAMHGAGSPQAQRIVTLGQVGIGETIAIAVQVIDGGDDEGLPLWRGNSDPPPKAA